MTAFDRFAIATGWYAAAIEYDDDATLERLERMHYRPSPLFSTRSLYDRIDQDNDEYQLDRAFYERRIAHYRRQDEQHSPQVYADVAGYVSSRHQSHVCPSCITDDMLGEADADATAAYDRFIPVWQTMTEAEQTDYAIVCDECAHAITTTLTAEGEQYEREQPHAVLIIEDHEPAHLEIHPTYASAERAAFDYVAQRAPDAAGRPCDDLADAIDTLQGNPAVWIIRAYAARKRDS